VAARVKDNHESEPILIVVILALANMYLARLDTERLKPPPGLLSAGNLIMNTFDIAAGYERFPAIVGE
jgi:hypothetical protein